eukprot:gene1260-921_t
MSKNLAPTLTQLEAISIFSKFAALPFMLFYQNMSRWALKRTMRSLQMVNEAVRLSRQREVLDLEVASTKKLWDDQHYDISDEDESDASDFNYPSSCSSDDSSDSSDDSSDSSDDSSDSSDDNSSSGVENSSGGDDSSRARDGSGSSCSSSESCDDASSSDSSHSSAAAPKNTDDGTDSDTADDCDFFSDDESILQWWPQRVLPRSTQAAGMRRYYTFVALHDMHSAILKHAVALEMFPIEKHVREKWQRSLYAQASIVFAQLRRILLPDGFVADDENINKLVLMCKSMKATYIEDLLKMVGRDLATVSECADRNGKWQYSWAHTLTNTWLPEKRMKVDSGSHGHEETVYTPVGEEIAIALAYIKKQIRRDARLALGVYESEKVGGMMNSLRDQHINYKVLSLSDFPNGVLMVRRTTMQKEMDHTAVEPSKLRDFLRTEFYIMFRGSNGWSRDDWKVNLWAFPVQGTIEHNGIELLSTTMHSGFMHRAKLIVKSIIEEMEGYLVQQRELYSVKATLELHQKLKIAVCGHSQGAALATILAHCLDHYFRQHVSSDVSMTRHINKVDVAFDWLQSTLSRVQNGVPQPFVEDHRKVVKILVENSCVRTKDELNDCITRLYEHRNLLLKGVTSFVQTWFSDVLILLVDPELDPNRVDALLSQFILDLCEVVPRTVFRQLEPKLIKYAADVRSLMEKALGVLKAAFETEEDTDQLRNLRTSVSVMLGVFLERRQTDGATQRRMEALRDGMHEEALRFENEVVGAIAQLRDLEGAILLTTRNIGQLDDPLCGLPPSIISYLEDLASVAPVRVSMEPLDDNSSSQSKLRDTFDRIRRSYDSHWQCGAFWRSDSGKAYHRAVRRLLNKVAIDVFEVVTSCSDGVRKELDKCREKAPGDVKMFQFVAFMLKAKFPSLCEPIALTTFANPGAFWFGDEEDEKSLLDTSMVKHATFRVDWDVIPLLGSVGGFTHGADYDNCFAFKSLFPNASLIDILYTSHLPRQYEAFILEICEERDPYGMVQSVRRVFHPSGCHELERWKSWGNHLLGCTLSKLGIGRDQDSDPTGARQLVTFFRTCSWMRETTLSLWCLGVRVGIAAINVKELVPTVLDGIGARGMGLMKAVTAVGTFGFREIYSFVTKLAGHPDTPRININRRRPSLVMLSLNINSCKGLSYKVGYANQDELHKSRKKFVNALKTFSQQKLDILVVDKSNVNDEMRGDFYKFFSRVYWVVFDDEDPVQTCWQRIKERGVYHPSLVYSYAALDILKGFNEGFERFNEGFERPAADANVISVQIKDPMDAWIDTINEACSLALRPIAVERPRVLPQIKYWMISLPEHQHVTLAYAPSAEETERLLPHFGEEIEIVTEVVYTNGRVKAAPVLPHPFLQEFGHNAIPHITLWTADGAEAVESNAMLANTAGLTSEPHVRRYRGIVSFVIK